MIELKPSPLGVRPASQDIDPTTNTVGAAVRAAPAVTIIMPALNAASTIINAIDSILQQTLENFELLICDDGSTDATASVVEAIADPRIRLIKNTVPQGAGAARDLLMAKARGKWITFCDSDDAWRPERLAILVSALDESDDAIAFDDIMECHNTERGMVPWRRLHGPRAFGANNAPVHFNAARLINSKRMFIKPFFSHTLLLESGAAHSLHAYGEDNFFLLKLLVRASELIYVPSALYFYRITPGSASKHAQRHEMLRDILESSLADFDTQPNVRAALMRKIQRVRRAEKYSPFAAAVKNKHFGSALRLLIRHPSLIAEFAARGLSDLPYHLHRLYRGGSTRGSK